MKHRAPLLICGITAVAACIVQHTVSVGRGEVDLALLFDAGHYQQTANMLADAFRHGLPVDPAQKTALADALMLDGPVLPGCAALMLIMITPLLKCPDWQYFLALQALFHAIAAMLVLLLAEKIFGRPAAEDKIFEQQSGFKWACAAGFFYAIYPTAVLAAQRFLAESLAAALVLGFVYLLSETGEKQKQNENEKQKESGKIIAQIALGIVAALLVFAKTGLLPVVALLLSYRLANAAKINFQKAIMALGALLIGAATVFTPWIITNHALTRTFQLLPQRAPVLNLFVGWNFVNDGYSTLPVAPYAPELADQLKATGSAPLAVAKLWWRHPGQSLSLALRKVARLYGLPWNDFRRQALFLSPNLQQILHLAILSFAALGLCLAAGSGAVETFWLAAAMIGGHIIFLLFETIPRYAFSSCGLTVLLAFYFLRQSAETLRRKKNGGSAASGGPLSTLSHPERILAAGAAVVLLPVSVGAAQFFYEGSHSERECKLKAGDSACRRISLDTTALDASEQVSTVYLLIDGVRDVGSSTIIVNGHVLPDKPTLLIEKYPQRAEHFDFGRLVISLMGRSTSDLRNWWVVPVSGKLLRHNDNEISLSAASPLRIYMESESIYYQEKFEADRIQRPGFLYISPGKIWTTNDSYEWRCGEPLMSRPIRPYPVSFVVPAGKATGEMVHKEGVFRILLGIPPAVNDGQNAGQSIWAEGDLNKAGWQTY